MCSVGECLNYSLTGEDELLSVLLRLDKSFEKGTQA